MDGGSDDSSLVRLVRPLPCSRSGNRPEGNFARIGRRPHSSVTHPSLALLTVLMYLNKVPRVNLYGGGVKASRR